MTTLYRGQRIKVREAHPLPADAAKVFEVTFLFWTKPPSGRRMAVVLNEGGDFLVHPHDIVAPLFATHLR